MNDKSILIIFLGNIHYDSRTSNFYKTFKDKRYTTKVISFDWLTEDFKTQKGDVSVYKLKKDFSSLLFYFKFSCILFWKILITKADFIFAEDIYTLPFAVIIGKLKRAKVIYDSREVYTHLAGLNKRKNLQGILSRIEKIFIKGVYKIVTTGELDSQYIEKEYNIENTIVIRNLPPYTKIENPFDFRKHYHLSREIKILLYQGVILHGRGLKSIFDLLNDLDNCVLIIIGGGEYSEYYMKLSVEKNLGKKVFFFGKITQSELLNYTAGADIGLSVIENLSLSYYYALPNKMFEYILTGVPVLASNFPQMKAVIDNYKVGLYIDPENLQEIKETLNLLLNDDVFRNKLKKNCLDVASELNWEKEIEKLLPFVDNT
jgi:glycosyltransferase involved in cell wall biosynthesis